MDKYYEPQEDSRLLLKYAVENISEDGLNILEVGVGSGFIISNLAHKFPKNSFFGTDINEFAIENTKRELPSINIKKGNLIEPFNDKFDLILFNAPYLPCEDGESYDSLEVIDKAIYGGEKGYEVLEGFIYQLNDKLENNGTCLVLFSSYTNLEYIEEVLRVNFFDFVVLEEKSEFFEKLYCLKITKSQLLKNLTDKKVTKIKSLSKGKHSVVLEGIYQKKEVIIKVGKFAHIQKEWLFEEKLKSEDFVPKPYFYEKISDKITYIVRDKINGELILDYIDNNSKDKVLDILERVLNICSRLDKLGINKFELTNPYKHIYITNDNKIYFIDFERCIFTDNPKNVTQILEFFRRNEPRLSSIGIKFSNDKLLEFGKKHKKEHIEIKIGNLLL